MYIDMSGDEGFKLGSAGPASSAFYVVAGLVFYEPGKTIAEITRLKDVLVMSEESEFKYSDLKPERRHAFFGMLGTMPFRWWALTVAKDSIHSPRLKDSGIEFRREFCAQFLRSCSQQTEIVAYIDDMEGTEEQRRAAREYLMREANRVERNKVTHVALVQSHKLQLVQAADMCAGAIREALEGRPKYKAMIVDKMANQWEWK